MYKEREREGESFVLVLCPGCRHPPWSCQNCAVLWWEWCCLVAVMLVGWRVAILAQRSRSILVTSLLQRSWYASHQGDGSTCLYKYISLTFQCPGSCNSKFKLESQSNIVLVQYKVLLYETTPCILFQLYLQTHTVDFRNFCST